MRSASGTAWGVTPSVALAYLISPVPVHWRARGHRRRPGKQAAVPAE